STHRVKHFRPDFCMSLAIFIHPIRLHTKQKAVSLHARECTVLGMRCIMLAGAAIMMISATAIAETANLKAIPLTAVQVDGDSFWGKRIATNREKTLAHNLKMCEQTGRIANFAKAAAAAGIHPGASTRTAFQGLFFNDSDVYKVLEG